LAAGVATGFVFDEESPAALMSAAGRAAALFHERQIWQRMIRRAMSRDFSWTAAARQYAAIYRTLRPDLVP
jgi:starch synthase